MELVITLGLGGWAILIVGSLIFGGIAQFVGETRDRLRVAGRRDRRGHRRARRQ